MRSTRRSRSCPRRARSGSKASAWAAAVVGLGVAFAVPAVAVAVSVGAGVAGADCTRCSRERTRPALPRPSHAPQYGRRAMAVVTRAYGEARPHARPGTMPRCCISRGSATTTSRTKPTARPPRRCARPPCILGVAVDVAWVATNAIEAIDDAALQGLDGLLIAPGSPYRSLDGALLAIEYARTRDVPLLGTCGGFQHIVVEFYAQRARRRRRRAWRDQPRRVDAGDHTPVVFARSGSGWTSTLSRGRRRLPPTGACVPTERFYCNFGLNPDFRDALVTGGLVVSGTDRTATFASSSIRISGSSWGRCSCRRRRAPPTMRIRSSSHS